MCLLSPAIWIRKGAVSRFEYTGFTGSETDLFSADRDISHNHAVGGKERDSVVAG